MANTVKLKDIAKKVGVTVKTVSYVMNGDYRHASKETCEQIKSTAKKMGYLTDSIARAMITGKSNVLGFISGNIKDEPTASIINGAMQKAASKNYFIKHFYLRPGLTPDELSRQCAAQKISGVIFYNTGLEILKSLTKKLAVAGIPSAIVGSSNFEGVTTHVTSSNHEGEGLVVEHLYALGHRIIAHHGSDFSLPYSRDRRDSFLNTAKRLGLVIPEYYYFASPIYEKRMEFLEKLFIKKTRKAPTAITCDSDAHAVAVITFLGKHGLKAPEDVSVAGYGDLEIGHGIVPLLTTISEPYQEMGAKAVELLLESAASGEMRPKKEVFGISLVARGSTGPVKKEIGES